MTTELATRATPDLPPVLAGSMTPEVRGRVGDFYNSVAMLFDAWVDRRKSEHTRRAYRGDGMAFVSFMGWQWPDDAANLLRVSLLDVQAFKADIGKQGGAGKTINRRISSLSSFYKFLAGAAAELRLPITVPNPAHAQFISRESSDPVDETRALSAVRARQLLAMPAGESVTALRDRAILKFYIYSGARLATGCRLKVPDFHQDGDEATLRFHLKGGRVKTKGIHFAAAEAIAEYIAAAAPRVRAAVPPSSRAALPNSERSRDDRTHHEPAADALSRAAPRRPAGSRAAGRVEGPRMRLLASFPAGDGRNPASRLRRAD